ncbi:uncharacterized protein LOC135842436 isoform X1 [Planococcus citri]|uniref:uncharacterized protein LOC135842436 isoform X1 n=1 Tax=Planococcus citri TaxID=170843 RepID=UPI0031F93FBE
MPDCIKNRALYSTCVTVLAFIGFAIATAATILPLWGYFVNPSTSYGNLQGDRGHFGPWQICKEAYHGKTKCGDTVTRFQPVAAVRIAGYFAILGVIFSAAFCVLNVLHLAMVVSRDKVVMKFKDAVMTKFVVSIVTAIDAIIVGVLFSLQTDDKENSYHVTRGESFYLQVGLIVINFLLFITALYDLIFSRKSNGDPTTVRDPTGVDATTFNNPGFREKKRTGWTFNFNFSYNDLSLLRHANLLSVIFATGVAVTNASGKPYSSMSGANGSTISMSTTFSSNGSTTAPSLTKSPLRSSLKKPRVSTDPSLGIHNPGFSGSSPTFPRDTMKKVRIQTQSTAV